jgi:hypothetical protein
MITDKKLSLLARQNALYLLIKHNSLKLFRKTTQEEVCEKLAQYGYVYDTNVKNHDRCPMIWKDIETINLSNDYDEVIINKNFEYWIGSEKETNDYLNLLWKRLTPSLKRYWHFLRKIKKDGQENLLTEKIVSVFNSQDVETWGVAVEDED